LRPAAIVSGSSAGNPRPVGVAEEPTRLTMLSVLA
jgi:hypothetical protein